MRELLRGYTAPDGRFNEVKDSVGNASATLGSISQSAWRAGA